MPSFAGSTCRTARVGGPEEETFTVRRHPQRQRRALRVARVMVRRPTITAAMISVALLVAACAGGEADGESAASTVSPSATTAAPPAGASRFCQLLAETDGEVKESWVGSAEHRSQLDGLAAAAPDDVRPDVERFRDHVREFVDPGLPGSADAARYPDDVRAAVGRIAEYRSQRC